MEQFTFQKVAPVKMLTNKLKKIMRKCARAQNWHKTKKKKKETTIFFTLEPEQRL